jgi:ABC-type uncharacterized transport system substrate-binding protein
MAGSFRDTTPLQADAGEVAVEQADEFELIVNLKTAKAFDVKIPYTVLARATKVIE